MLNEFWAGMLKRKWGPWADTEENLFYKLFLRIQELEEKVRKMEERYECDGK